MVMCLAGCAVTEQDYPAAWDPLPAAAGDCAYFAGNYADRGESSGTSAQPSLTYGLFGHHSAWQKASRVQFSFPRDGVLEISAWHGDDKPLLTRALTAAAGEFRCQDGRLVVRSRRWVAEDIVAGRQDMTIEFSRTGSQLVAHVKEKTYGTIFAVVPIAGTAAHWYRFARMTP